MTAKSANVLACVEPEVKEKEPITEDIITKQEFHSIMETGLSQAKADQSRPVADVFANLRREL